MSYKLVAIDAVNFYKAQNISPLEAWKKAAGKAFPTSFESQEKSYPKSTFLGLAGLGKIKGITVGNYTSSVLNKEYAITALSILQKQSVVETSPKELWRQTLVKLNKPQQIRHNGQMDVVIGLWEQKLIK